MLWNEVVHYNRIKKIEFHGIKGIDTTKDIAQVSGDYELIYSVEERIERIRYDIMMIYLNGKLIYLQLLELNKNNSLIHKVKAVNEDYYILNEDEILYLEVNHNHVIWNCVGRKIISNMTLCYLEDVLSNRFVRIQRGYLVNKDYVKCIRRCEVVMENGDILCIPSKKYTRVKEQLM